ncbi:hypothetical protein Cob_v001371 [Colletotrichum orbiculare MAFF 240422]|uniref:Secreted protein n=1 Tax=Colletotrichum orbiculare (strain 104-T / ATCC 96160 / CBS 514.97 / LARS 414 / MAFF 240422) TaxID=1213857 RepID=A0A484G7E0_COLOR|nr:hypothetical protein Cob_v001371 [Colletotrichum orbiculare MAFF 240422]
MLLRSVLAVALFGASTLAWEAFCTDATHPTDPNLWASTTRGCCTSPWTFKSSSNFCDTGSERTNAFCSCCQRTQAALCMNVGG